MSTETAQQLAQLPRDIGAVSGQDIATALDKAEADHRNFLQYLIAADPLSYDALQILLLWTGSHPNLNPSASISMTASMSLMLNVILDAYSLNDHHLERFLLEHHWLRGNNLT